MTKNAKYYHKTRKNRPKQAVFTYGGEKGIRVIAKRASLLAKAERQPCDARVHAVGGTMQRNVQNPGSEHKKGIRSCLLQSNLG